MRLLILWTGLVAVGAAQQLQQTPGTGCAADGYTVNSITGEPVPRAQLQFMGPSPSATLSDSSGRWKVSGIFCGRLNIFATKTGYLGPKPDARVGAVSVTSPDSPAHDLRVEMTPQSVVMGKVVDEAGDPLQSVQITVMTSRVLEGKRVFLQSAGDATNDLGDYRVPGLSAGKAIVCARAPLDARSQMKDEGAVLTKRKLLSRARGRRGGQRDGPCGGSRGTGEFHAYEPGIGEDPRQNSGYPSAWRSHLVAVAEKCPAKRRTKSPGDYTERWRIRGAWGASGGLAVVGGLLGGERKTVRKSSGGRGRRGS